MVQFGSAGGSLTCLGSAAHEENLLRFFKVPQPEAGL